MRTVLADKGKIIQDVLIPLREKALGLVMKSEDKDVLEEVVALLSGKKRPCAYSYEEMAASLHEAEEDYHAERYVSHEELFAKYGL